MVADPFAGILTGVLSNVVCSIFVPNSMYYSIISALIGWLTSWYFNRFKPGKIRLFFVLTAGFALIGGILRTAIE